MDAGLMALKANSAGNMTYIAPRSLIGEQFFNTGPKAIAPRPLYLARESIITVATLGVLHFDLDWPKALLGVQSIDWAFDLVAYPSPMANSEHIACEIKKGRREVDRLLAEMHKFAALPPLNASSGEAKNNAYKKILGLRARRPPFFFWAVGPDGYNAAFRVEYGDREMITLQEVPTEALGYSGPVTD